MKSFKVFASLSIYSFLLIFSCGARAQSQDDLFNTAPSFYLLKERGETVEIHTCYGGSGRADKRGLDGLGMACSDPVIVDREDLNRFVVNLSLELDALGPENRKSENNREALAILGGLFGTIVPATVSIGFFVDNFFKGFLVAISNKKVLIPAAVAGVSFFAARALWKDVREEGDYRTIREDLRSGIRKGVVSKGLFGENRHKEQMFQMFEDFLSEYGRPPEDVPAT